MLNIWSRHLVTYLRASVARVHTKNSLACKLLDYRSLTNDIRRLQIFRTLSSDFDLIPFHTIEAAQVDWTFLLPLFLNSVSFPFLKLFWRKLVLFQIYIDATNGTEFMGLEFLTESVRCEFGVGVWCWGGDGDLRCMGVDEYCPILLLI